MSGNRRVTITVNGVDPVELVVSDGDTVEVSVDGRVGVGFDLDGDTLTVGAWDADGDWVELAEASVEG